MKKLSILFLLLSCMILTLNAGTGVYGDYPFEGMCGDSLYYSFSVSDSTLSITGAGPMDDFSNSSDDAPWASFRHLIRHVYIEEGATTVGSGTFSGCPVLSSAVIPPTVTSLGHAAFSNSGTDTKNLVIHIPEGVTSIGGSIFASSGLRVLSIPGTLTHITDAAFEGCRNIDSIFIHSIVPPGIDTWDVFMNTDLGRTVLTVPYGSLENYRGFFGWGGCGIIREALTPRLFLNSLEVSAGILTPRFHPDTLNYTVAVPYAIDSIAVSATSPEVFTVHGAGIYKLTVGKNILTVAPEFITQDSTFEKIYTVTVTREYPAATRKINIQNVSVYFDGGILCVDSPAAERVNIYSVTGTLLSSFDKPAGASASPFTAHRSPFYLIVKGSSGWSYKLVLKAPRSILSW